eukprot:668485_1
MAQTLRCVDELIRKIESQCKDEQKRDPSLEMPSVESTVLLVCDMQKRNNCANNPSIEHMLINSTFVIESCFEFGIPCIFSQMDDNTNIYPRIVKLIEDDKETKDTERIHTCKKTAFSMFQDANIRRLLHKMDKRNVIILGCNTYNSLVQTVIDLVSSDYIVHVCMDCMDIKDKQSRDFLCKRFMTIGANVTTAQSIIYQLMKDKNHPKFKRIISHAKQHTNALKAANLWE